MSIPPSPDSFSQMFRPQLDIREIRSNNLESESVTTSRQTALFFDNAEPRGIAVPEQRFYRCSDYGFMSSLPQHSMDTEAESGVTSSIASLDELLSTLPFDSPSIANPQNLNSQSQARMEDYRPPVNPLLAGDAGPQHLAATELSPTMTDPPNLYIDSVAPVAYCNTPDACYTHLLHMMSEQKIDVHTFVASMLNAGHLDASRLRDIISRSSGGHLTIPSGRRRRNTPRKQHKCSECSAQETTQWRRHPHNGAVLCNRCGQKAYRAHSKNT
ncbi:hypothetical protein R3P38DRAFT_3514231 [Favolaschia claudopus]|uniref:GATA-type domain-containing protein n=1 Tax=Favolaschia claudopus TaxID=2862362 RepID=A0AAW0BV45_9AGAR